MIHTGADPVVVVGPAATVDTIGVHLAVALVALVALVAVAEATVEGLDLIAGHQMEVVGTVEDLGAAMVAVAAAMEGIEVQAVMAAVVVAGQVAKVLVALVVLVGQAPAVQEDLTAATLAVVWAVAAATTEEAVVASMAAAAGGHRAAGGVPVVLPAAAAAAAAAHSSRGRLLLPCGYEVSRSVHKSRRSTAFSWATISSRSRAGLAWTATAGRRGTHG